MSSINGRAVGLPRPMAPYQNRTLPVPWNVSGSWPICVAAGNTIAEHHVVWSSIEEHSTTRCQVCGLIVPPNEVTLFFCPDGYTIDNGPLHKTCADIAETRCPYLAGNIVVERVDNQPEYRAKQLGTA